MFQTLFFGVVVLASLFIGTLSRRTIPENYGRAHSVNTAHEDEKMKAWERERKRNKMSDWHLHTNSFLHLFFSYFTCPLTSGTHRPTNCERFGVCPKDSFYVQLHFTNKWIVKLRGKRKEVEKKKNKKPNQDRTWFFFFFFFFFCNSVVDCHDANARPNMTTTKSNVCVLCCLCWNKVTTTNTNLCVWIQDKTQDPVFVLELYWADNLTNAMHVLRASAFLTHSGLHVAPCLGQKEHNKQTKMPHRKWKEEKEKKIKRKKRN